MPNKLFIPTILILFLFLNSLQAVNQINSLKVTGISIINDNGLESRKKAINDAFVKALKKTILQFNIEVNEEQLNTLLNNPERFITGYEIIEEKQNGNILNEKLNVSINYSKLIDFLKKSPKQVNKPTYILIFCNNSDNASILDNKCNNIIKNHLKNIYNTIFLNTPDNFDGIFTLPRDILIVTSYKINNSRKIYSIAKEFDNISIDITIYGSSNDILKTFSFERKIVTSIGKNPIEAINPNIFNKLSNYITVLKQEIVKNKKLENSPSEFYFVAKNFSNYSSIKNLEKFFQKFNINYSLISIENQSFIYKIRGISKEELAKTVKFSTLEYNYLEIADKMTISFN